MPSSAVGVTLISTSQKSAKAYFMKLYINNKGRYHAEYKYKCIILRVFYVSCLPVIEGKAVA